jgi:hypothetical protein
MTSVPSPIKAEWDESVNIAQAADRAGIEAMIPVARWRGMGDEVTFITATLTLLHGPQG